MVQGIRDGRRANLRKETLKRSGAGQEIDVKVAQETSGESRMAVGGSHTGHIDKGYIISRNLKTSKAD